MGIRDRIRASLVPATDEAAAVQIAPAVAARELFRRFWPFARPYRGRIVLGLLVLALVPLLEAVGIWLFGVLVDEVLVPRDFGALPWVLGAMAALAIVGGVVGFADDYLAAFVGERFVLDLRVHVLGHLQRVGLHALDRRRLGDLLSRVTSDVQAIESFVLAGVSEGLAAVLRLAVFTTALFVLEWRLALAALVVVPLFWLTARCFGRMLKTVAREKRRRTGSLTALAEERLAGAALVQTHGREAQETERLAVEGRRIVEAELAATRIRAISTPVVDLIELVGAAAVLTLGTWALSEGSLTLGGLLAFLAYLSRMYGPARDLGSLSTTIFAAAAAAERVVEILAERPAVQDRPDARPLGPVRGELELRRVHYTHPRSSRAALRGVDLHVPAGHVVAIVGPSGAGKSTLARLLVRLNDPDAGAVLLDGRDLRDARLPDVRQAVAVLLQETLLFDAAIRENVAYGRPEATEEELRAALRDAGALTFVDALPDGLDTRVGQRGRALSGGQQRRIALARTLLRDAPVVVLDEPTTGLDAATRDELLPALRRVVQGRTAVVITHDPVVAQALAGDVVELVEGRVLPAPELVA